VTAAGLRDHLASLAILLVIKCNGGGRGAEQILEGAGADVELLMTDH
jgi:hypothetical protein